MGTMSGGPCQHFDCSNRNSFGYCRTTACINEHYQQEQWGSPLTTNKSESVVKKPPAIRPMQLDEFDYYFDGICFIITRNRHFFLSCCGTEAETQHIVELLRKDAANDVDIQHVGYSEEECGRDK